MEQKTFTRSQLSELLVDGLGRATKAHSAGEIQTTLAKLGIFFSRTVVKDLLDELVEESRIAFTVSTFFREGAPRAGRAYHSLELLEADGPEDPFEKLTEDTPTQVRENPPPSRPKSLIELAEELARRSL